MVINKQKIEQKIADIVKKEGAELIEFKLAMSGPNKTIYCVVDYPQGGITIDVCSRINKIARKSLEDEDFLGNDFSLEINSPGLNRKLRTLLDFRRVSNREVSLWLTEPILDKEYLEVEVLGVDNDKLTVKYKDEIIDIDFCKIKVGKEKITIQKQ